MFQSITFYVGEKTLGIYGEEFPLGALTTEVLNITPEEYQALDSRLKSAIRYGSLPMAYSATLASP